METNSQLINFEYNGCIIPFALTSSDVMINAIEMVKLFPKKRINDFLNNQQTKELIKVIESETGIPASQLVVVVKGNYSSGIQQGTRMHRKIAIAFAMWLNPLFYSWCLGKLDEIITNGYALRDAEINRVTAEVNNLNSIINTQQPQVNYYNQILTTSENLYSTEQICKELGLGISSKTLIKKLEESGLVYRRIDNKWFLSSSCDKSGYLKTTSIIDKKTGKPRNVRRWTEYGKHWIWSLKKQLNLV